MKAFSHWFWFCVRFCLREYLDYQDTLCTPNDPCNIHTASALNVAWFWGVYSLDYVSDIAVTSRITVDKCLLWVRDPALNGTTVQRWKEWIIKLCLCGVSAQLFPQHRSLNRERLTHCDTVESNREQVHSGTDGEKGDVSVRETLNYLIKTPVEGHDVFSLFLVVLFKSHCVFLPENTQNGGLARVQLNITDCHSCGYDP